MAESAAEGGEASAFGGSSVLGVNNLQRAIDTFDRTVDRLSSLISSAAQARTQYESGQQTAGSWNKFSNWAGGNNGGSATFGGTPFNPNTKTGSSGTSGGAHRAEGATSYKNASPFGFGGGDHTSRTNGMSKAAFAMGMASSAASSVRAITGQTKDDSRRDSMTYLTTSQVMSTGQTINAPRLFSYGGQYAFSGTDQASATMGTWQMAGYSAGSAGFQQMQRFNAQQGLSSPMMSASQAQQSVGGLYGVRGYAGLRQVGIQTLKPGGQRQSPLNVANQILSQIDPQKTVTSDQDIAQLLNDPFSPLNMTLGAWVSNGNLSGNEVQAVKDNIQTILKARSHGVNVSKLSSLMSAAAKSPTGDAAKTLQGMHIGDSAMQREKDLGAAQRGRTIGGLSGFNDGLQSSTKALASFTSVINGFMNDTGLSHIAGLWSGGTMHGKMGAAMGLLGAVPGGSELMHLGGGALSGAGSLIGHAVGMIPGIGGPNDSRMSTNAKGGSGGSSGGGGGGSSSRGSGVVRFIYPVNPHPITEAYGVSNSGYAAGHHTGVDFGVPVGTPVHAAAAGTVVNAGPGGDYGNYVVIDHHCGLWTLYGHNSRLTVQVGTQVSQGALIAYSGNTGNTTGPHCHFEVRKGANRYGMDVNPMPYLGGGVSVGTTNTPGAATSGGGSPTTGSAGSTNLGSGASYTSTTTSGGSPGIGTTFGAGMSELDVLASGGSSSSGGGGSVMTTTSSGSAGTSGGAAPSNPTVGPPLQAPGISTGSNNGRRYSKLANEGSVELAAKKYGWGNGSEWGSLYQLVMSESGFNNVAQNPTSTAYGMFQFLDSTWAGYGGHKTSDPNVQAALGMKYIKARYGDPVHAWNFHRAHNWYDKGAWEIQSDETARVHKGEMIIQKPAADQIRQILLNGNPYGAMGNQAKGSGQTVLQFNEGSIKITVQGSGSTAQTGRAIAKDFVDTLTQDARIKALQAGTR